MLASPVKLRVLALFQNHGITIHDYLFNYLWKNFGIRLDCWPIEKVNAKTLLGFDLVLNVICNDVLHEQRLTLIESWCKEAKIQLINNLQGLKNCRRHRSYSIWSKNSVHCARVEKAPSKTALLNHNMKYPVILRNEYSHKGTTMKLINNLDELEKQDQRLFGKYTVAIEFHDYRGPDGYYRKYRCVLMGDRVAPRHVISSREWNIHSDSRQPDRMDIHKQEEYAFWERPLHEKDELLRAKNLLGLDYTIADYALGEDGTPFYFEMNPCFSVIDPRAFQRVWAYQLDAVHRYCETFADFLLTGRAEYRPDYVNLPLVL